MQSFDWSFWRIWLLCASLLTGQISFGADQDLQSKAASKRNKKNEAFSPDKIRPDSEVPLNPERYIWRLSTKRATLDKNSKEVPVHMFDDISNERVVVGSAPVGESINLDEIRMYASRHFYRYNWSGRAQGAKKFSSRATFWVDGMNIDYAGKK